MVVTGSEVSRGIGSAAGGSPGEHGRLGLETMRCHPVAGDRINLYGLVSYLPDPLGSFLDEIRTELVPSCFAQSHLSVLPPRALAFDEADAQQQLAEAVQDLRPFQVELRDVEIFDKTFVIYLGVGRGGDELRRMHECLNF